MFKLFRKDKVKSLKNDCNVPINILPTHQETERYRIEYDRAISNLNGVLANPYFTKNKRFVVIHFSIKENGINQILKDKTTFSKQMSDKFILKNMSGNLRRLYIHILERKLKPHIEYWSDCAGTDYGLAVYVSF